MRKTCIATISTLAAAMILVPSTSALAADAGDFRNLASSQGLKTPGVRVAQLTDKDAEKGRVEVHAFAHRTPATLTALVDKQSVHARERSKVKPKVQTPPSPPRYPDTPTGWVNEALDRTDTPQSWFSGVYTIGKRESNFRPKAKNNWDINAANGVASQGVMQCIPPTFNAHHEPGTSWDITDPVANISAAINYIKGRYGHISNVQQADPNKPPKGY